MRSYESLLTSLRHVPKSEFSGVIASVAGGLLEAAGLAGVAVIGQPCLVPRDNREPVRGEVIGLRGDMTLILTESAPEGLRSGDAVVLEPFLPVCPSASWRGKVINALGQIQSPLGLVQASMGDKAYPLRGNPPAAATRRRIGGRIPTGCNGINTFLPLCRGQRVGLFAGSGVGKSTLLANLARTADADVIVIGLIGERGREVNEFVTQTLQAQGMERAVVITATADQSPLLKRRAAFLTMATAEYFRDCGQHVLLLFDSVTRFAEAQREIGLAAGEPPALRAFPPSVFSELSALVERAGPGCDNTSMGDITGVFTVLVQGSDFEEPVADAVRGSLDGHVILDRDIAERGRYPAVNILRSVSRSLPHCASEAENTLLAQSRRLMAAYADMAPMIRLGAYKMGSDRETDAAIVAHPRFEQFLADAQSMNIDEGFVQLHKIINNEPDEG